MRTSKLGRSSVRVSELGVGGGPLGGLFAPLDDATAEAALAAAWDAGVRYFDTSPHYGLGTSERRMGAFLRGQPREEFALSTKVGRLLEPQEAGGRDDDQGFAVPATQRRVWDFSRNGVRRSLEHSLARLGFDHVDILLLHDAEEHFDWALREGYPALAELRDEGVVSAIGAGMHDNVKLTTLVRETDVDVVMLSGRYTLLEQRALDDFLPSCEERGVSVLAASVFNSGVLALPRPAEDAMFDYEPASDEALEKAHRIADVCEAHGVTLPQAAVAFPRTHPAVAGVVLGVRTAEEMRRNAEIFASAVPAAVWADLRDAGLLDSRAPVPG